MEIKIPLIFNKKNGQIIGYFKKKDLPRELYRNVKLSKKENKKLIVDFKELI